MTADILLELEDPSDNLLNLPDIPQARAYLIDSLEYKWLLSRILAMTRTRPTLGTDLNIRQDLLEKIQCDGSGGKTGDGSITTIQVEVEWHFPSFVEQQYTETEDVLLQQVLCCSGLADNAFVAPCSEYVELLWPRLGKETVLCLSTGLGSEFTKTSGMLLRSSSN
jgi:hypothetical protein